MKRRIWGNITFLVKIVYSYDFVLLLSFKYHEKLDELTHYKGVFLFQAQILQLHTRNSQNILLKFKSVCANHNMLYDLTEKNRIWSKISLLESQERPNFVN